MTTTIAEVPNGATARLITARRGLPNGRAVAGALLVTAAATGAFLVATAGDSTPDTSYLVVSSPVAVGDPVTRADVTPVPLDLGDVVARSALSSTTELVAAVALRDLPEGQLLTVDDLLASPTVDGAPLGTVHELTIPVPADWSPEFLLPGDRVTILATVSDPAVLTTVVATEDATVIRFDTDDGGIGSRSTALLTLAIDDPGEVITVADLAQRGALTVVRTTRAIGDRYPPPGGIARTLRSEERR